MKESTVESVMLTHFTLVVFSYDDHRAVAKQSEVLEGTTKNFHPREYDFCGENKNRM